MQKILAFILIAIFFPLTSYSGWQAMNITDDNLSAIKFMSGNQIGFATSLGNMYYTYDYGTTWGKSPISSSRTFYDFAIIDTNKLFVVGTSGSIYRTTNGGVNWNSITSGETESFNSIDFYGNNAVIVGTGRTVIVSNDSGINWTSLDSLLDLANIPNHELHDVEFLTSTNIVAVGNLGIIIKSTNLGNSWIKISTGTTDNIQSVNFPTANIGYACGYNGRILKTIDGGSTWSTLTKYTNSNLKAIYFTNEISGTAVGENGTVISTSDGGNTWKSLSISGNDNLNSVYYSSTDYTYIVGANGSSVRTDNNAAGSLMQLSLISPNSDTTYTSDKNAEISWNGTNMENQNIDIFYSSNNGTSWNFISTVNYSNLSYSWNIPDLASTQMLIKIQHHFNIGLKDISDNNFEVTTNKINITTPNITSRYQAGKSVEITWNSYDITSLNLEYTLDGNTWQTIANNVPASSGVFFWNSPLSSSSICRIKATDISNSANTSTSEQFTLANLFVQNPSDGSVVNPNYQLPISWSSSLIDTVRIDYSRDSTNWLKIGSTPASNSSFTWNSTPNINEDVWLKISDNSYQNIYDIHKLSIAATEEISIVEPNASVSYKLGQTVNIRWSHAIVDNVKIEASYDNGANWNTLIAAISADVNQYNWTPSQLSGSALIRISDVLNPSLFDISDNTFKISDINILSPGPGQDIQAESQININWSASFVDNVKIEYSIDNWSTSTEVVNSISAQAGSYIWTVPDVNSSNARIKISSVDNSAIFKEVVFNIRQTLDLKLISPIGGELLKTGNQYPITWNSKNVASLDIKYSLDSGSTWSKVVDMIDASTSPYYWTIPDVSSQKCMIKISQSTDPSIYAISSSVFSISNARINLLSPNGGELWYINDTKEIKWDSKGIINLGIAYQIHPDSSWVTISSSEPASPSMQSNWDIPVIPSTHVKIKIFDTKNPGIYDISDSEFTIAGIKLTSLNDGEKLIFREKTQITWEAVEVTDIQISYSTDNGTNWQIIENSYNAESENYTWDAPYPPSDSCKLRIRDNQNSSLFDISDVNFSINGLLLENNLNGKELLVGTEYPISWLSQDVENVQIEYSTDRGKNWLTVISYTESDGIYSWLVPNTPAEYCKLKVTDRDNHEVYDMNIGTFKIIGTGINLITPNGKESWALGTQEIIKWSSVNIEYINIDISYNNGVTPVRIATAIPATTNEYIWTVSGAPSTECQIRISDSDNANLTTVSQSNFTITGGIFPPPQHWTYTSHTGKNANIILPTSVKPLVSGRSLSSGDALGVFYTDLSGKEKSAGYGIWDNGNLSVTVWGDNDQTTAKDGFEIEETYSLRLWDAQLGKETGARVSYSSGNNFFTDNGISIIGTMNAHEKMRIILKPGIWSIISSYLLPANSNIDTVMKDVQSLELMKDELGDLYYPSQEINTISNWEVTDGYQIYVSQEDTLDIEGTLVKANNYPIVMESTKWYIISYLYNVPIPITTALSTIDSSIVLVKNDDGQIWYPAYGINQIGNMHPTEGYKIVLNEHNTLVYNSGNLVPKVAVQKEMLNDVYEVTYKQTGSNCNIILNLLDFDSGDEFAIKTNNGMVVGTGINYNGKIAITAWGDNPNSGHTDGLTSNETCNLYYWSKEDNKEYRIKIEQYKDVLSGLINTGEMPYLSDAIYEVAISKSNITGIEESDYKIALYPNPASDYVMIKNGDFSKYEIHNLLGSLMQSGVISNNYIDISHLHSGTYSLRLMSDKLATTLNFTIVR